MTDDDPFDLQRFVDAQDGVIDTVVAELRAGQKRSHWMWFVFPQIEGLGHSPMARRFALSGSAEAMAYLGHPVLGPRLEDCTRLVLAIEGRSIRAIFGTPDDLKFHSCVTLFARVAEKPGLFEAALRQSFGGRPDGAILAKLQPSNPR